jgi:cell division transport system permease protein
VSDKYTKRRLQSSSLTTVISIALVLFMLGLLGMILLSTKKVTDYVKEHLLISVYLNPDASEADILSLQNNLNAARFVRSTTFTSAKTAADNFKKELGEDFVNSIGYNPLPSSIDVYLKAEYANNDSISWIRKELQEQKQVVADVDYKEAHVSAVNDHIRTISIVILAFTGLLMLIAIALINNTIRLAIYSKRFLIRTMQLVGATQGFIRKPFLLTGMIQGVYGAIIALFMLMGFFYVLNRIFPFLVKMLLDINLLAMMSGALVFLGILIGLICTWFAVHKYLRIRTSELYY